METFEDFYRLLLILYCRGIEVRDVLGAQMMGHSIALHESTYFQAMQQRDAATIAARLRGES